MAADDYENWASGDRGASEKRVHILFARDSAEEAAVHQVILREIAAARTPTVVTISTGAALTNTGPQFTSRPAARSNCATCAWACADIFCSQSSTE